MAQSELIMAQDPAADFFVTADIRRHVLTIVGELDARTVALARQAAAGLPSAVGRDLVIDFAGLTFCGAAGINLVVELDEVQRRRGGAAIVVHADRTVRRLFRSCGVGHLLGE